MREISPSAVKWIGSIYLDRNFCTFLYDGCYYKAQLPTAFLPAKAYAQIFNQLAKKGLIPATILSELQIECLGSIFRQHTEAFNVPFFYINWHSLKEAALLWLKMAEELARRNLWTQDAHSRNIVFQGAMSPAWCDVGSFIPLRKDFYLGEFDEYIRFFVYPLLLPQSREIFDVFRAVSNKGVPHDLAHGLGADLPFSEIFRDGDYFSAIRLLRDIVKNTSYSFPAGQWSAYYDRDEKDLDDSEKGSQPARIELFFRIFNTVSPRTVVDIGANTGLFSRYMAKSAEVLAIEPDAVAVAKALKVLRESAASLKIKFALTDVNESWQAMGRGELNRGQMATALALTHHLFFTMRYTWKYIAMILSEHCTEALLTEFMPWACAQRRRQRRCRQIIRRRISQGLWKNTSKKWRYCHIPCRRAHRRACSCSAHKSGRGRGTMAGGWCPRRYWARHVMMANSDPSGC